MFSWIESASEKQKKIFCETKQKNVLANHRPTLWSSPVSTT